MTGYIKKMWKVSRESWYHYISRQYSVWVIAQIQSGTYCTYESHMLVYHKSEYLSHSVLNACHIELHSMSSELQYVYVWQGCMS